MSLIQKVVNVILWSIIVLKRRDNAPVVKHVFGNVIEKIMIDKDLDKTAGMVKRDIKKHTRWKI